MSIEDFQTAVLVESAWVPTEDRVENASRISGTIDGQLYAAIVSTALAQDRPAAVAYLRMLAERDA